jgi:mono/diheme cytochrome c family protein
MKSFRLPLVMVVILTLGLYSFESAYQNKDWVVPDSANKMKNPTDADDEDNLDIGKTLYDKHCKSCHGKDGLGDGPKAAELDSDAGDFSSEEFQSQTDGALLYKTTEGRDDMPSFAKKIPSEEDRWLVVNYMRTFAE